MTVHKSQGSEWNYVIYIFPNWKENYDFINKHLIYTALSRTRKQCFIIGNMNKFNEQINKAVIQRYSSI